VIKRDMRTIKKGNSIHLRKHPEECRQRAQNVRAKKSSKPKKKKTKKKKKKKKRKRKKKKIARGKRP